MAYAMFSRLTARPGRRDDLAGYLLRAAGLLETDPDCVHYLVATSSEADVVYVYETWTDERAHAVSLERAEIRSLIQAAMPSIAGAPEQTVLAVLGGKGVSS
ncbi:MAG TPA: antibiotic biosynthesis monooxygenase [Jatrophihabitans sp.]|jgi:quinol monooxygenase YgiN|nr:antibiotic biosynthesis monooxygenase [Jatrophihabitans sp.]